VDKRSCGRLSQYSRTDRPINHRITWLARFGARS